MSSTAGSHRAPIHLSIKGHSFQEQEIPLTGHAFLATWFEDTWGEFLVFYIMMLIGFIFLFFMMKSTARLREIRKNVAETIRDQRNRKFDVEQFSSMPGGGMF